MSMSLKAFDCCGGIAYCCAQLGLVDEKIDKYEAVKRLEKESQKWLYEDRSSFWGDFTQSPSRISQQLENSLIKFQEEGIKPGIAVDLGCGNSSSTIYLLQRGWKVIAVDSSKKVLENLHKRANEQGSNWITDGQLTLVCQKIETYEFPQNIQIIVANDSLPYCDPTKVKYVWDRAYISLAKGGRIIGNFFPDPMNTLVEEIQRTLMGGWFTDKAVVNALLDETGYQKEVCAYNKYWFQSDPRCIEFVGRKV